MQVSVLHSNAKKRTRFFRNKMDFNASLKDFKENNSTSQNMYKIFGSEVLLGYYEKISRSKRVLQGVFSSISPVLSCRRSQRWDERHDKRWDTSVVSHGNLLLSMFLELTFTL